MYLKKAGILPAIDEAEASINPASAVVRDLVTSFLFPEVEREQVQEQVSIESKRHTQAARDAIEAVAKQVDASA